MDVEKDNGRSGLRESEVALDLTRLKNWSNFEETAYRDFSQQRAERRSITHRRLDEGRRASAPVSEAAVEASAPSVPEAELSVERPVVPEEGLPVTSERGTKPVAAPAPEALAVPQFLPVPAVLPVPQLVPALQIVPEPVRGAARAAEATARAAVAVYSPAGGVGKSTICAHLARALYSRGERVLLVDGSGQSMLATYFGAEEEREGLRQFCAPGETHASVLVMCSETTDSEWLHREIEPLMSGVDRTVFDLGNASPALADEVLTLCQVVLVPVVPGPQAALVVSRVKARLEKLRARGAAVPRAFYVMNRFNEESEQDRNALQALQAQCGEALAPVMLERSDEVEYAFAERMTISDFHTAAPLSLQYEKLAGWLRRMLPPSTPATHRRWSEV
jgi:cellulose biosynthesis protein BcsQ